MKQRSSNKIELISTSPTGPFAVEHFKQVYHIPLDKYKAKQILLSMWYPVKQSLDASSISKYPVIIFSHARGSSVLFYKSILEELASHGYCILALDHDYDFPVKRGRSKLYELRNRLIDIETVINQFKYLDSSFASIADIGNMGILGHSLGGSIAFNICCSDARFKAGVNIDGALLRLPEVSYGLKSPFMTIASKYFEPGYRPSKCDFDLLKLDKRSYRRMIREHEKQIQKLVDQTQADLYHLIIRRAHHWSFSDLLLDAACKNFELEHSKVLKITCSLLLNFFDCYLKGKPLITLKNTLCGYSQAKEVLF